MVEAAFFYRLRLITFDFDLSVFSFSLWRGFSPYGMDRVSSKALQGRFSSSNTLFPAEDNDLPLILKENFEASKEIRHPAKCIF